MKLNMMMKRPVCFPDFDPKVILHDISCPTAARAWKEYGTALLLYNEPCMEASSSTTEIVSALRTQHAAVTITRTGCTRFTISDSKISLTLDGPDEGTISVSFPEESGSLDVTDFGPADVARFIRMLFARYDKIAKWYKQCSN